MAAGSRGQWGSAAVPWSCDQLFHGHVISCYMVMWSAVTWTCVLAVRRRCRPRGGGTGPASASSGPGSVLNNGDRMQTYWDPVTNTAAALSREGPPTDESHAAAQDEDPVQSSDLHKLVCFISEERVNTWTHEHMSIHSMKDQHVCVMILLHSSLNLFFLS